MNNEQKTSFFTAISDISDGLVFVRAVGGHSKTETIKETPNAEILKPYNVKYMPDILVHVTPFRNAFSIARQGLIPGGPDGRREHIHFLPLHALVHSPEHCRPNGDVVLFYSALNLDTNNIPLYMTKNYYIVTDTPIPHHCCIFAYDVRNKAEVKHRIFPLQEPEIIEQHDDQQTIMNVLSFYQEYFNNRLVLTEQHGRPFHAPSTTREARQITEQSMTQEDFDALKRWTNQQLQKNVGIMPLLEHLETDEGLPFAQRIMRESGRKWPQDAEQTGEMDLERRKARWAEQRGEDISLIVPDDEEYGDYTDVDEEEEILEEQHADVLEEAIDETAQRGKRWVRKDRQPSPSPADTAADTADNASTITFRPRTQSTRHRSRTPEPGNIRSTNKMAREVLQDACHASERRKKRVFYQRPMSLVTTVATQHLCFAVDAAMPGALSVISIVKNNVYAQHHFFRARCRLRLYHHPLNATMSSVTSQQLSTLPTTCTRDSAAGSQEIVSVYAKRTSMISREKSKREHPLAAQPWIVHL